MSARICILHGGQLATCPRMLKAADALAQAGYRVRVVCARHLDWATAADAVVRAVRAERADLGRTWRHTAVRFDEGSPHRFVSGLRYRAARLLASRAGADRAPMAVAARAWCRFHDELLAAAVAEPADLVYGGAGATLWTAARAARRLGVPYALDLEDFHGGELAGDDDFGRLSNALAERIEREVLGGAAFLTAGSAAIAEAYAAERGVAPIAVHNTFPLPPEPPPLAPPPSRAGAGLRLYWFSQTIGPGRGLEPAVRAVGEAGIDAGLDLRGRAIAEYLARLQALAARVAPRLRIAALPPIPPDEMVASCRGYDVGLALEEGRSRNNDLALSNKTLTYPLAGLAVALTTTTGQRPFAAALGEGALAVPPGDHLALAAGLGRWASDREALARARAASWEAARRRWHFEHPADRGALLDAVAGALGAHPGSRPRATGVHA